MDKSASTFGLGLLRRRTVYLPTWKGWLALLLLFVGMGYFFLRGIYAFLSPTHPLGAEVLVVEGWIPDYCLAEALQTFRSRPYRLLVVTGGPLSPGGQFASFNTHAEFAAYRLKEMGFHADSMVVLPSEFTRKDRTYLEGQALKAWMGQTGTHLSAVDLYSFSAHARRSRLLFEQALGGGTRVGIYAPKDLGFDASVWWTSSNGVRQVLDETIAYGYAVVWSGI